MRVLIADRNARLLESISRTFARQFTIRTAASCEQCNDLLAEGEFDLALISEKLADGPGLQLLGQIARSSPDTLRVFAARRSRLQLLKGKLGPFGLFRTLSYPINPQELLSTLTLAQTGLAMGAPAPEEAPGVEPPREVPTPPPAAAEVRPSVERISLTLADATFTIDVPRTILSQPRVRRSNSAPAHRPTRTARQAPAPAASVRNAAPGVPSGVRQSRQVTSQPPSDASQLHRAAAERPSAASQSQRASAEEPSTASQTHRAAAQQPSAASQTHRTAAQQLPAASQPRRAVAQQSPAPLRSQRAAPEPAASAPQSTRAQQSPPSHPARSQAAVAHSATPARSVSQSGASQRASTSHRAANRPVVAAEPAHPTRSKIVLAATSVVVFLVTTLTLNMNDASVHVTRASTPPPKIAPPTPTENVTPAALAPAFRPEPAVARRVEPKPDAQPAGPQIAASTPRVADPSTFGAEAYEPIYSN